MSDFTHLHVHSHYSLLSALPKIPQLVARAKELGMTSLALTDNGNMYGTISFYKTCKKNDIKPILGVDFYVAHRTRHDKEAGIDNRRHRLILLAKTYEGYKNLIKLVTHAHTEGFYYKPRIDSELLEQYHQDLVCIVPIFNGHASSLIQSQRNTDAQEVLQTYQKLFGNDSVFLEITHHPEIEGHSAGVEKVIAFSKKHSIPVVATNDVYYLHPDDRRARATLMSVQSSGEREARSFNENTADFSFTDHQTMHERFSHYPEALENTQKIVDMCNCEIELGDWLFPNFDLPHEKTAESELRRLVSEGLEKRNLEKTEHVLQRINFELDTICDKGYAPYFLVVGDLLRFAHEHGILSTIRGSVAGSLITYVLGITKINPLEYELPFERFLNPERPSPPDIDMDYADNRRDEMIDYARQKYGTDKVAQIGTFGTMMARGAVRDTARALGYDYATGDRIAKIIPFGSQGFPMSIDKALELEPDLKKMYDNDEDVREIIDMAKKIEGCARHISVHAAGVVISPIALDEIVPTQYDPKGEGKIITQYDMHNVEDAGLLKFDFLGLKNLSILADVIRRVKKIYGQDIDIETIPLDDQTTYEMLARGETEALFQLNGTAMTKFLKELRPSTIHDINAMIALYRPGPMKNIPEYIARKHGRKQVTYYHPKMQSFLDRSFGILVYQDDLMSTALNIAGYTWKTVDKFRKAIGKKIPKEMAEQHEIFVAGCMEHSGMSKESAEGLWELFEPFQGYGFNKAHAASYGRVAYQTAYMKAHFPAAYMSAVLTADAGDIDEIAKMVSECARMDIPVLPPDVNQSFEDFAVVTKETSGEDREKIRFGLYSIKNFGQGIAKAIIEERKKNGPYTSLENFLERIHDRNLNKKSLEALIQAGALDSFGERGNMLQNIETLLEYSRETNQRDTSQESLFASMGTGNEHSQLSLPKTEPATLEQKLLWEKELLGLYISGHPMDAHAKLLEETQSIIGNARQAHVGMTIVAYGIIESIRTLMTKKGEKMAIVKLADRTDSIEAVFFPEAYKETHEMLVPGACIGIKGKLSKRNDEPNIIADKVKII